jgi:prolyl oligopeptidase
MPRYNYPPAQKLDQIDDYHGTKVSDPYRWLETPDSPETQAFIAAQNALTDSYLAQCQSREGFREALTDAWNYVKYSAPLRAGNYYYFLKNDGLQNQPVLYRVLISTEATAQDKLDAELDAPIDLDAEIEEVLDPNTLSDDGTIAMVNWVVSWDGQQLAYAISVGGSDEQEIRIRKTGNNTDSPETLKWTRLGGISWLPDNSGFFYNRYPEPGSVANEDLQAYNRLYLHIVNTPQSADTLIYERPDAKELNFPPEVTEDGKFLVLRVWHGAINRNRLYYAELNDQGHVTGEIIQLIDEADASYLFIGNKDRTFYLLTDLDAPNGRVMAIDLDNPARENWQTVIPEDKNSIAFVRMVNQQFVVVRQQDAIHRLDLFTLDGEHSSEITLPTLGTILGIQGQPSHQEMFFSFVSYLSPITQLRYDFNTQKLDSFRMPNLSFKPSDYMTKQVFYHSKDGTRVPLFLVYRCDTELNGNLPVLLFGYGGYSISLNPDFYSWAIPWMDKGGVLAVACIRGGAEYGEAWHQGGMLEKKQNVFDDFNAAAEWLIDNNYTRPEQLASMGGSNGGLLVAACMLQRPELWGAVVCRVPVTDMLRYQRFTAGRYWTPEYGNAEENEEHFNFLYAYSPLHNVKPGTQYPPIFIHTAESDDRVLPLHALKFAAALQDAADEENENPILLQVETKAGHGLGKPTSKQIAQYADFLSFVWHVFGRD